MHTKEEELNNLEVNPWLRLRNRAVSFILRPYHLLKSILMLTGIIAWLMTATLLFTTFTLLENLPHFEDGFQGAKTQTIERIERRLNDSHAAPVHRQLNWIKLDKINRELIYAIVMSEDGDFFSHQGIDYDALINALGENIKRREWSFGASTISQQTIKNIYFTESKTLYRKLKELIATRRIEQTLSKNEILELYLNLVEFGPEIYGIDAAAHYYFKQSPQTLNAAQGAFLAILMPSPRKYHFTVYQNKHLAKRHKRKYKRILQDMHYKEYISPLQYKTYLNWSFF